ncbi:uncharacterized protein LOC106467230 [Limulus polyphemus]|uniref:Uncharacterized protein LOC106467230 n=1 Tax=Limulus polyphemus TaxID=6850 RepID=A0ABM1BJ40_LIMPO|nr:uncharacterized protein LOC106467230 [Limulus polyphemus]
MRQIDVNHSNQSVVWKTLYKTPTKVKYQFNVGDQRSIKKEREQESLQKNTSKLDKFFKPAKELILDDVDDEKVGEESQREVHSGSDDGEIADKSSKSMESDLGMWPYKITEDMRVYWLTTGSEACWIMNAGIVKSIKYDGKHKCYFSKSMFYRSITNGEKIRSRLCYSPSTGKAFCFNCKLFSNSSEDHAFSKYGFSEWKNASQRLESHENSQVHRDATITLTTKYRVIGCVNSLITRQYQSECHYMKALLERVIATIKFLAERGLAFRGHNECIGSPNNGKFLGTLELLAQFDPFLATHVEKNGNKGKGYLYNFFSASTYWWEILVGELGKNLAVVKRLGDTRWSAHASATADLYQGYEKVNSALLRIQMKGQTRDKKPEVL